MLNHQKVISRRKKIAIRSLNVADSIDIFPADKGNDTVVVDAEDYTISIIDLLVRNTYKKQKWDSIGNTLRKAKQLIQESSIELYVKL